MNEETARYLAEYRSASRDDRGSIFGVLSLACGVLVCAGAGLPWIKAQAMFANIERTGLDSGGDGWIFVGLGGFIVLAALTQLAMARTLLSRWAIAIAGSASFLLAVFEY